MPQRVDESARTLMRTAVALIAGLALGFVLGWSGVREAVAVGGEGAAAG